MKYINLISNFAEFKELKSIDNNTLIGVLEDVFRHALQKQFESDENFDVIKRKKVLCRYFQEADDLKAFQEMRCDLFC